MQSIDARLASFQQVLKPRSAAKPGWPLTTGTHPHLTPQRLAEAGFYHYPGTKDVDAEDDTCQCFLCHLELGGWDEKDDPFEEHAKRGKCAWAETVCAVRVEKREGRGKVNLVVDEEALLPTSAGNVHSRMQTFGNHWPHQSKKKWKPTEFNLASAGFVYYPGEFSDDAVMCPHCDYSVEGWEPKDDPMELHQSKRPDCPFFRITLANPASSSSRSAAASKTKAGTGVSRKTRAGTVASTVAASIADPDEVNDLLGSQAEPLPVKKGRKGRATTATQMDKPAKTRGARGRKTARAVKDIEEESNDEEAESVAAVDSQVETIQEPQPGAADDGEEKQAGDVTVKAPLKKWGRPKKTDATQPSQTQTESELEPAQPTVTDGKRVKKAAGSDKASKPKRATKAAGSAGTLPRSTGRKVMPVAESVVGDDSEAEMVQGDNGVAESGTALEEEKDAVHDRVGQEAEEPRSPVPSQKVPRGRASKAQPESTVRASVDLGTSTRGISKPVKSTKAGKSRSTAIHKGEVEMSDKVLDEVVPAKAKSDAASQSNRSKSSRSTDEPAAVLEPASNAARSSRKKENIPERSRDSVKPKAKSAPANREKNKPLPPVPRSDDQPTPRPMNQLSQFVNVPPTSPLGTPGPSLSFKTALTSPVASARPLPTQSIPIVVANSNHDVGTSSGSTNVHFSLSDEMRKEASTGTVGAIAMEGEAMDADLDMGMTVEQLIQSEMKDRLGKMKRKGDEMIMEWEERAREARKRIAAL